MEWKQQLSSSGNLSHSNFDWSLPGALKEKKKIKPGHQLLTKSNCPVESDCSQDCNAITASRKQKNSFLTQTLPLLLPVCNKAMQILAVRQALPIIQGENAFSTKLIQLTCDLAFWK